jgi:hypothetical protein
MDFNTFVITGPNTLTASIFYNLLGSVAAASALAIGQTASLATNCQTDTFTVTGSGGYSPPVICGTNTGYHSTCNFIATAALVIGFTLTKPTPIKTAEKVIRNTNVTHQWYVYKNQISCLDLNL